jgi:hypothetical protein
MALREAAGRLNVDEAEEWDVQLPHPDPRLAHQIEDLADAL